MIATFATGTEKTDLIFKAYEESAYSKVIALSADIPVTPEVKLARSLCFIYNRENQNIVKGIRGLRELYNSKTVSKAVWRVAALSYGRVIQSLRNRPDVYGEIEKDVDPGTVFNRIISEAGDSREACAAMMFLSIVAFSTEKKDDFDNIFNRIVDFYKKYRGDPLSLVPLFLFTEGKYIELNHDYRSAVELLVKAHNIGIANPKDEEVILYRVGRIYDLKLKKRDKAMLFYDLFLEKYPESGFAPTIQRFRDNIKMNADTQSGKARSK